MTTTRELQILADELSELLPPPSTSLPQQRQIAGNGRWKVVPIGGGAYALRVEYTTQDGETVTMRAEREISGFPNTLRQSLEFMLTVHSATRHHWIAI